LTYLQMIYKVFFLSNLLVSTFKADDKLLLKIYVSREMNLSLKKQNLDRINND
jgi:hypothetical protein